MSLVNHAFLNITVPHLTENPGTVEAEFNQERNQPILRRIQDYRVHVPRFKIPTHNIPIFRPNKTAGYYQIGFHWVGDNSNQASVSPVSIPVDMTEIYHYSTFLILVNEAIFTAWATYIANTNNSPEILRENETLTLSRPPQFRIRNGTIELVSYAQQNISGDFDTNVLTSRDTNKTNIIMNENLYRYFSGFASEENDFFDFSVSLAFVSPLTVSEVEVIPEDFPSLHTWQTLNRIIITTNVPLHKEIISTALNSDAVRSEYILTDFQVPDSLWRMRENLILVPQGEKRWANFASTGDITKFDIKVFYQTKDLNTYPITIPRGEDFNIKVEFERIIKPIVISEHA